MFGLFAKMQVRCLWLAAFSVLLVVKGPLCFAVPEDDEASVEAAAEETETKDEVEPVVYATPSIPPNAFLAEAFDDIPSFEKKWVRSKAKKEGVAEDIAKYDGLWVVESLEKDALPGDRGLVLKSKAKHAAIAAPLNRPFRFTDKPLVMQYEVSLQNGQDCGGAYIKLLSHKDGGLNLEEFHDKTPYTIMFGPDKCGNDMKLHFIFRHENPLNKNIEEKHAKRSKDKFEEVFKDKRPHLYTLVVRPDNSYEISLDHDVINSGSLLDDFTPPVNPPKEIDDPKDYMPDDWDEQEKITDPHATKPDDWDEDAPRQIPDASAVKTDGWLDDEPEMIPDPDAVKPDDWDDEMDGEWEAPLINNPACEKASGCGEWRPPMVDNPDYKGKWKAPLMDNPNYRGKWTPRKIPNPDYYEDLEPFKMTPIAGVGLELWSMTDGIHFDNVLVTDSIAEARQFAQETFDLKLLQLDGQSTTFRRIINYSNKHPWLYGIYVLLLAIPVILIVACCCAEESKKDKTAERKKTDEPETDDPHAEGELEDESEDVVATEVSEVTSAEEAIESDKEGEPEGEKAADMDEPLEDAEEEEKEEMDEMPASEETEQVTARTSPRLRKARKD